MIPTSRLGSAVGVGLVAAAALAFYGASQYTQRTCEGWDQDHVKSLVAARLAESPREYMSAEFVPGAAARYMKSDQGGRWTLDIEALRRDGLVEELRAVVKCSGDIEFIAMSKGG